MRQSSVPKPAAASGRLMRLRWWQSSSKMRPKPWWNRLRQGGSTGSSPIGQVVQQTFVQIGQTAREIIINLQRTLIRILESLAKTAPLAAADTTSIRNAALAGLPVVDLAPLLANCDCTIPHWAIAFLGLLLDGATDREESLGSAA